MLAALFLAVALPCNQFEIPLIADCSCSCNCLVDSHRGHLPADYCENSPLLECDSVEELEWHVYCLRSAAHRMRWQTKMDRIKAMRLLYVSVTDYKFYLAKIYQQEEAACRLDCLADKLEARIECLQSGQCPTEPKTDESCESDRE